MDFIQQWQKQTEISQTRMTNWIGLSSSKYYDWKDRYGRVNEHNALVPRDHWLETWEQQAIVSFHEKYPLEGYRRLTYMMLDQDVTAVSPSSVYRVLSSAGLLKRWNSRKSRKGTGFKQPLRPHEHWHVDISYLNIQGTFYYLCSILDGCSRYLVHWEIRESMKEEDVEVIVQRAREKFPLVKPRIISDNGPQFIAKEFKSFIKICGMTHVRTAPYYPQSNGKVERWHRTVKEECVRKQSPLSLEDARRVIRKFVTHYNSVRLHGAIGYVTPKDLLDGKEKEIFKARDRKLEMARERRKKNRAELRQTG